MARLATHFPEFATTKSGPAAGVWVAEWRAQAGSVRRAGWTDAAHVGRRVVARRGTRTPRWWAPADRRSRTPPPRKFGNKSHLEQRRAHAASDVAPFSNRRALLSLDRPRASPNPWEARGDRKFPRGKRPRRQYSRSPDALRMTRERSPVRPTRPGTCCGTRLSSSRSRSSAFLSTSC